MTGTLPLYARALLPKRRGGALPDTCSDRAAQPTDPVRLRRYQQVCGLPGDAAALPPLYPHLDAFRLSLEVMARRDFPYPLPGLVHVANEVERLRRVGADEPLAHRVWFGAATPHPRGVVFPVHATAAVDGVAVWRSVSTYLRRAPTAVAAWRSADRTPPPLTPVGPGWHAPAGVGRAYGAVTGDRNPVHLHPWTARFLGFRRAIAHGMWTKARALAVLEASGVAVPDAVRIAVRFRAPVFLPTELRLLAGPFGEGWTFEVGSDEGGADRQRTHLRGELVPLGAAG